MALRPRAVRDGRHRDRSGGRGIGADVARSAPNMTRRIRAVLAEATLEAPKPARDPRRPPRPSHRASRPSAGGDAVPAARLSGRDMVGRDHRTLRLAGAGKRARSRDSGGFGGRSRHRARGAAGPGGDHADLYRLPRHPGDRARHPRSAGRGRLSRHADRNDAVAALDHGLDQRGGKAKLKAYGIAPPTRRAVECPQCGSTQTEEISRFGSTPCKAQWRCRDCLEPFDLFKCH